MEMKNLMEVTCLNVQYTKEIMMLRQTWVIC